MNTFKSKPRPSSHHVTPATPAALSRRWGARFLRPKSHERATLRVTWPLRHSLGRPRLSHPCPSSPSHAHHTPPCQGRHGCHLLSSPGRPGAGRPGSGWTSVRAAVRSAPRAELCQAAGYLEWCRPSTPRPERGSAIPRQLPEAGQSTCAHSQPCPPPGPAFTHPAGPGSLRSVPIPTPIPSPRRH